MLLLKIILVIVLMASNHDTDFLSMSSSSSNSSPSPSLSSPPNSECTSSVSEKTEIWYGEEVAMNRLIQLMSTAKSKVDVCGDSLSPSFFMGFLHTSVEKNTYFFENLWNRALPVNQKIEIEAGIAPEFFEVITDHEKASQVLIDLAKSVNNEALFFLPNYKAMVRIDRLATTIRILDGNNSSYSMYIVNGEKFASAELVEPKAEKFSEAIGFALYSNRKITVDLFKSFFQLLWSVC